MSQDSATIHVDADDFVRLDMDDEFHEGLLLSASQGVFLHWHVTQEAKDLEILTIARNFVEYMSRSPEKVDIASSSEYPTFTERLSTTEVNQERSLLRGVVDRIQLKVHICSLDVWAHLHSISMKTASVGWACPQLSKDVLTKAMASINATGVRFMRSVRSPMA